MKYILILLTLVSCSSFEERGFKINSTSKEFQECVERFLKIGVSPKDSVLICKESVQPVQQKENRMTKEEILQNEHAVVRFTAYWCGPCKALAPVFEELATENPTVKTYVVDVDKLPEIASAFGVRGIPTVLAVRKNNVEATLVGNQPKVELEKLFK